jgi:chromosome segregation ATPase
MNTAEARYQALLDRREIVEKDKAKIERVIQDLDRNKNQLLQSIWEKVYEFS